MSERIYTSPQVCTRCREKKIRCDLRLPSCKHCAAADVQCCFWDPILEKTVYCGYLHFLHQRESSLKRKIQQRSDELGQLLSPSRSNSVPSSTATGSNHHGDTIGGTTFPSQTLYLGPGHSAEIVQRFLKAGLEWHRQKRLPLPNFHLSVPTQAYYSLLESSQSASGPCDLGNLELSGLLTPPTKNALMQHYLSVVVPEFDFLHGDLESLLDDLDLLELSGSSANSANSITTIIVLTISLALVVRDLQTSLSDAFMRLRRALKEFVETGITVDDPLERQRLLCTILIACALCELISPESYQVWDLLGAAMSALDELCLGYRSHHLNLDDEYLKLARALLKLESSVVLHFQRPSSFPGKITSSGAHSINEQSIVWSSVANIAQMLMDTPDVSVADTVTLIPPGLRVELPDGRVTLSSALLYITLQPLFTTEEILSGQALDESTSNTFHTVARSACTIIDHLSELNKSGKVFGLWLEADRVLRCGMIWLYHLVHHSQSGEVVGIQSSTSDTGHAMAPVLQVTSLLSSFAARFKGASASLRAWEVCVALLWPMLSSSGSKL